MTGTLCSHTFFIPKFESHLVITVLRCSCLGSASFNMTEPVCPLFFRRCCRTDRHMARGDTFCQSISPPQVHLFLAGLVRVGIKLLTQDRPDALDNLYHSSIAPVVCHYRSRLYINREMPSASSLFWSKISLSKKHLTSPLLLESLQHHKQQARGHCLGDETLHRNLTRKHLTPGVHSLLFISSFWQVPLVRPHRHQIRRGIRGSHVVKTVVRVTTAVMSLSGKDYFLQSNETPKHHLKKSKNNHFWPCVTNNGFRWRRLGIIRFLVQKHTSR